jgi:tetratricopeptide (TPR) repeat protein
MRRIIFAALFVSAPALAQRLELPTLSPSAKVSQTAGLTEISVEYSSPGVRGRKIWGGLLPYGEVWRAGANAPTKVSFSKDVTINNAPVPAGDYALFVIPAKAPAAWTVILNKGLGHGPLQYKKEEDFLRFDVKPVAIADRERLGFSFPEFGNDHATLALEWEKVRLPIAIKLDTAKQATQAIKNLEENPQGAWTQAARYELEQTKNFDAGLKLVEKSISIQEDWLNTWTKAQLLAAKGDKKEALPLAQKADELGAKNPPRYFYAGEVKKALAEWKK